jgi:hypothetical protein
VASPGTSGGAGLVGGMQTKRRGADSGFVGPESYIIFETLIMNRIQNYESKTRCERECLFRTRKEITTNYKFKS